MGVSDSIVMKFGGTSVQDAESIERVIEIVKSQVARSPIVVISALAGITNELVACADEAANGRGESAIDRVYAISFRHRELIERLLKSTRTAEIQQLTHSISELKSRIEGVVVLRELSLRSRDAILAYGERLSSKILTAAMSERGLHVEWIDSSRVILTDENFSNANPIFEFEGLNSEFHRKGSKIPVIPGFTGKSKQGNVTTLGRGGSDTSAAIVGALLQSKEVQIWTDVSGMYSADPRHIPEATMIPHLSFDEALELAYFGACVIHPRAVAIAKQHGIPIRILNTFDPLHPGTLVDETGSGKPLHAVAVSKELTVVPLASLQPNTPPLLIYSGSADGSVRAVLREKSASNRVALITIVSTALANTSAILSRVYDVLASSSIRILAAVHARNLSLVVHETDVDIAARAIHAALRNINTL